MANTLLTDIKAFLDESGMGPSYFGKVACGNSELVGRLESGKTITLETADRIREYMAERRAAKQQGAAA